MEKEIKPSERNTNKHTEQGMQLLDKSIKQSGVIESIATATDGTIITGHARHELFIKNGLKPKFIKLEKDEFAVLETDIENNTKEYFEAQILANTTSIKNQDLDIETIEVIVDEFDIDIEEVGVDENDADGNEVEKVPPKTDLKEKVQYYQKSDFSYISLFKKSKDGVELKTLKVEGNEYFERICFIFYEYIKKNIRNKKTCLVSPPSRRHKDWNLAQQIVIYLAGKLNCNYDIDLFQANSMSKYSPDIELKKSLEYDTYVIIDDIITTGFTISKCAELLNGKNIFVFVAIDNH